MRGVSESRSRRAGEWRFTIEVGSSPFPLSTGDGVAAPLRALFWVFIQWVVVLRLGLLLLLTLLYHLKEICVDVPKLHGWLDLAMLRTKTPSGVAFILVYELVTLEHIGVHLEVEENRIVFFSLTYRSVSGVDLNVLINRQYCDNVVVLSLDSLVDRAKDERQIEFFKLQTSQTQNVRLARLAFSDAIGSNPPRALTLFLHF